MTDGRSCAVCGTTPARGSAGASTLHDGWVRLCHEGDDPTCYQKWQWGQRGLTSLDDVIKELGIDISEDA